MKKIGKLEWTEDKTKWFRKASMFAKKIVVRGNKKDKNEQYIGVTFSIADGNYCSFKPKVCVTFKGGSNSANIIINNREEMELLIKGIEIHYRENENSIWEVVENEVLKYESRREQELLYELEEIRIKREEYDKEKQQAQRN